MAVRGQTVGDLYIDVHANTRPFTNEVKAAVIKQAAAKAAKAFGQEFNERVAIEAARFRTQFADALITGDFARFRKESETTNETAKRLVATLAEMRNQGDIFSRQYREMKRGVLLWRDRLNLAEEEKARLAELRKQIKLLSAETDIFEGRAKRALTAFAQQAKGAEGEARKFGKSMREDLDFKGLVPGTIKYGEAVDEAREKIAAFHREQRRNLEASRAEARKSIEEMRRVAEQRLELDVDLDPGSVAKIRERLRLLKQQEKDLDIEVNLESAKAAAELAFMTRNRSAKVNVDVDQRRMGTVERRLRERFSKLGKSLSTSLSSPLKRVGDQVGKSFSRMDNTVRAVMLLIAGMGPQIAALGSALSSQLVGAVSSAVVGLGGALVALGPAAAGGAWGLALVVRSVKDLEKNAPAAKRAWSDLNKQIGHDAKDFSKSFAPAIGNFADTLTRLWREDIVGARLGEAFGSIVDSFTKVLQSPAYTAFERAMETTIPDAIAKFGDGFASVMEGVLRILAAAAPYTEILSERFQAWGDAFAATMGRIAADGTFQRFMDQAMESLEVLTGLTGTLMDTLGSLFMAAAPGGDAFLRLLTDLAQQFGDFIRSAEGNRAIQEWMENGLVVIRAVFDAVGALGKALADMVTPDTVQDVVDFFGQLSNFLPVLGHVLTAIGNLDILTLIGQAFEQVGRALEPVLPAVQEFARILGDEVSNVLLALQPALETLAALIGAAATSLQPFIQALGTFLVEALNSVKPLLDGLIALLKDQSTFYVVEVLTRLIDVLGTALTPVLEVVSSLLGSFLTALGAIMRAVEPLTPVFDAVASVIGSTLAAALRLSLVPMEILSQLILALIPDVESFEDVMVKLEPVFEAITQGAEWLADAIDNLSDWLNNHLVPSVDEVRGALEGVGDVMAWIATPLSKMHEGLLTSENQVAQWARNLFGIAKQVPGQVASGVDSTSKAAADSTERMAIQMYNRVGSIVASKHNQIVRMVNGAVGATDRLAATVNPNVLAAQTAADKAATSWQKYSAALREVTYAATGSSGGGGGGGGGGGSAKGGAAKAIALTTKEIGELGKAVRDGLKIKELVDKASVTSAVDSLVKLLRGSLDKASKEQKKDIKAAIKELLGAEEALGELAKKRAKNSAALERANKQLEEALSLRNNFREQITNDAKAFASVLSVEIDPEKALVADDVIDNMRSKLTELRKFFRNIKQLRDLGLDEGALQQIIEAGAESGGAVAQALVAGGADAVKEINELQGEINTIAEKMGKQTSKWFYQVGVDAAKGLVEGLEKEQARIEKSMKKMVKKIVKEVRKELGIKSPSTVFADIGRNMARGLGSGWSKAIRPVRAAVEKDAALSALNAGATSSSATQRNVNVASGAIVVQTPMSDPTMVANSILDRLVSRLA